MRNWSSRWIGVLAALALVPAAAVAQVADDDEPKAKRIRRAATDSGLSRIEVRLEAKGQGETYTLASGGTVKLEADPVLLTRHFAGVAKERRKNPNLPGTVDLELLHDARGTARFLLAAKVFRERRYCIMLDEIVQNCAGFPPPQKQVYERGQFLFGVAEAEANRFAQQLGATIRRAHSATKTAERSVPSASPRALLEALYRRAARSSQPDWLDGERRGAYFGSELMDLWDRVDLAQAGGNREAPLDADPIAATTSLTLKSARVGPTKPNRDDRSRASVEVTIVYKEPTSPHPVLYHMVREKGRWRVEDIGHTETLSRQLKAYLAKALPSED